MRLIMKYLKPFALILTVCIALLFGQAICDLSLPNLMSDIVNVGIQQSGIESSPRAISEQGYQLMQQFMTQEDRERFGKAYEKQNVTESDQRLQDLYKTKANQSLYFATDDTGLMDQANAAYGRSAYAILSFLQEKAAEAGINATENQEENGFADMEITKLYDQLPLLKTMPAAVFSNAVEAAGKVDRMVSEKVGVTFTKLFYQELGINLQTVQSRYIWRLGFQMLLVSLAVVIAAVLINLISSVVSARVSKNLRQDLFAKVQAFSSAEMDQFSTASLITRSTNDIQQIQVLIMMGVRMLCYAPILGIGGILFAVEKSASLSWIIGGSVVLLLAILLIILSLVMPKFNLMQKLTDRLNLVSRETLTGMLVIRAFGNEEQEEKRFAQANSDLSDTNLFVQKVMSLVMPCLMLVMNLMNLMIIWVGGHAVADITLQIGDLIAFIQYGMHIIMAFMMIAMMFVFVPRSLVSARRIAETLDMPILVQDKSQPKEVEKINGEISFENVCFRYDHAEAYVLEDISFTARPGETTAFIGSTGSGKSTVVNLIPRFYDVTKGCVKLDGVDVRDLPQAQLRDSIGYVPQKGILFSGTVKSNLAFGREDASEEEMVEALEIAQAKAFVFEDERGLGLPIAQGGANVSGGQRQRLSIARALVKQAKIYIFDDSFSALDYKTDAKLRQELKLHTAGATMLIVAQRVSTIMNADQIIVLEKGKIVGKGKHSDLLKTCGAYREIAESQLQKEELA